MRKQTFKIDELSVSQSQKKISISHEEKKILLGGYRKNRKLQSNNEIWDFSLGSMILQHKAEPPLSTSRQNAARLNSPNEALYRRWLCSFAESLYDTLTFSDFAGPKEKMNIFLLTYFSNIRLDWKIVHLFTQNSPRQNLLRRRKFTLDVLKVHALNVWIFEILAKIKNATWFSW